MKPNLVTHQQPDAYTSPWSLRRRLGILLWEYAWPLACGWTPKPLNSWRIIVLRAFGTEVHGKPFVHGRARIQQPWNLVLHDRACIGDRANAYCLDRIILHPHCTVAQEAYLCTGTHDFKQPHLPLQTAPIIVETGAFIGARAFVLPGITVGANSIVGAGSIVTKHVAPGMIVAGNPARCVGTNSV